MLSGRSSICSCVLATMNRFHFPSASGSVQGGNTSVSQPPRISELMQTPQHHWSGSAADAASGSYETVANGVASNRSPCFGWAGHW